MNTGRNNDSNLPAFLNDLILLSMMFVIAAILTAAMVFQYYGGEIPCPLCLLQRAAMFGVCFGIIMHFRHGHSARNTGMSMLFALFLLIVSARQTLLDIYPRPGHSYIGSAVFGLHMPVWSVIIAFVVLLVYSLKLAMLGGADLQNDRKPPQILSDAAAVSSAYVITLCAINFVSVILQCGFDACHTMGYKLL